MRNIIILILTFFCDVLLGQYQIQQVGNGLPNSSHTPKLLRVDTLVMKDSCGEESVTLTIDRPVHCRLEYITEYYYDDSTNSKNFQISSGQKISNKKFGTWTFTDGYFYENKREVSRNYDKYFINDYEIIYDESITKKIEVDIKNKTAFCDFIYYYEQKDTIKMRIDYWLIDNNTFARCYTSSGTELFCKKVIYINEEFKLLFEGYYNRKIY